MKLDGTKEIKRLVIYFFFDKDGIVDRYVFHMLEELRKYSGEIFFVANGKLSVECREKLSKKIPEENILVRNNEGFDVWAYKDGLEHYGWEKLEEFDEVILMNYTVFGPLYPFSEMFDEMNKRDLDFWGITKHHKVDYDVFGTCKYKYIPEHIQSSFLVIRRSLMKTNEYHALWEKMPEIKSYADSVGLYEAIFTKDFMDKGFKAEAYIDTSDLEGFTRYPLMMMANELIINRRCPIMKVKSFSQNYFDILGETIGNCSIDAFDYIREHLEYDTDMMLEHVIRTANMADIKHIMHLNYILPREYVLHKHNTAHSKIALMMHLYFPDLIEKSLGYALSMPADSDLIITVSSDEMEKQVNEALEVISGHFGKARVLVIENRGRDVSSLLVGCAPFVENYELICFVHDKKTTQVKPYCMGESFAFKCFENTLASKEYVENVICTFEDNPRLGMLMPPPPNHGSWWDTLGNEWYSNYENTVKLAEELDLNVDITWKHEPIAPLGTMFWFRPTAMKKLFDHGWKYKDFPKEPNRMDGTLLHAVERVYCYVVQNSGYYCAWSMTDRFTRIELTNLCYMLRNINLNNIESFPRRNTSLSKTRKRIKSFFKKLLPAKLWEKARQKYHKKGGTKWVG